MNKMPPEELSETLHYLAECAMLAERISKQPCCNTCGKLKTCEYRPEWGEPTRINCPLWEK